MYNTNVNGGVFVALRAFSASFVSQLFALLLRISQIAELIYTCFCLMHLTLMFYYFTE